MHKLCFVPNPAYSKTIESLGDQLRAARLDNFMSIKVFVEELHANECTVARWEVKGAQPRPGILTRVRKFLADHQSKLAFQ